jgi:hypothetical protein
MKTRNILAVLHGEEVIESSGLAVDKKQRSLKKSKRDRTADLLNAMEHYEFLMLQNAENTVNFWEKCKIWMDKISDFIIVLLLINTDSTRFLGLILMFVGG